MRRWICILTLEADSEEDVRTKLLEVDGHEIHWQREWEIEEEEIYSDGDKEKLKAIEKKFKKQKIC